VKLQALVGVIAGLILSAHPALAQDRWQLTLHSGAILWDLELVRLAGDTVILRQTDADSTVRLPVMRVDELRLVQKSEKHAFAPDAQGNGNALMGGADLIWQLTLLNRTDRLRVLRQILHDYVPESRTDP
jgi:hypothetical protein